MLLLTLLAQEEPAAMEVVVEEEAVTLQSPTPGLELTPCATAPPPSVAGMPAVGQLTFQVVVKRGAVKVVATTPVEPSLAWLTPCLERELASHEWSRGRHEVEVTVEPPGE